VEVILIRHAKAGTADPNTWPDDRQRPLTAEGVSEQRAAARAMRKMGISFGFLVTSPLVRAVQTAEVVAEVYKWKEPPQVADEIGPSCTTGTVAKLLARFPPDSTVALVGHEPSFSRVAAGFIGKSGDAAIDLKKSGVIGLTFDGHPEASRGALLYHLKPGHLRKLSR
jgi:phosphohistidine phosphatase